MIVHECDGRTDGQTDRITITKTLQRVASHGKNWDYIVIRHGNTKVRRRKWFKDVYQATEIVEDNAGVGQTTSPNGLG